jgi:hypothetical protein
MSKARDLANAGTALTTVDATELGYLDGVTSAVQTQIDSKEATLPSQTGNTGKYLTTDGTDKSWGIVSQYALPTQTSNSGKYLTTDGTTESWGTISAGGMTLLSTTTLAGESTTVTISDFSYNYLTIIATGATWSGNGNLAIKPNGSTTLCASYFAYWTGSETGNGGTPASYMQTGLNTNNGTNAAVIDIFNYASTAAFKPFRLVHGSTNSSSVGQAYTNDGVIKTTSQITSLEFIQNSSVNMTGGTILVYGVK